MKWVLLGFALLVSPLACAHTPTPKADWAAVDAAFREARWRTDHCLDPNHPKCDALWLIREEVEAIVQATRAQFAEERKRSCEP